MNSKSGTLKCAHCDYTSVRPYNLRRHVVSKHSVRNDDLVVRNDNLSVRNDDLIVGNDDLSVRNDDLIVGNDDLEHSSDSLQCMNCERTFKFRCRLAAHADKCTGMYEPRECDYCNKMFSHRTAKYRHHKICKVKLEKDAQAIVPVTAGTSHQGAQCDTAIAEDTPPATEANGAAITTNNNTTNNNTINSHNVQNLTNSNNNTQIINLAVYTNSSDSNIDFNIGHIDASALLPFLKKGKQVPPELLTNAVRQWTQQLLSNNDNKCVKKTNMRSAHSKVHMGNNTWESRLDKEVYPTMMNNIADEFHNYLSEKYRKNVYEALDKFTSYMASDGYCSTDNDRAIINAYKTLVRELKLRMFDHTKPESRTV